MELTKIFYKIFYSGKGEKIAKYYRKLGAKIGKNFRCHGFPSFGSEPYLIEIGDDCVFSTKVTFVNHDGGVIVIDRLLNKKYDKISKIRIGNNVFLGMNTSIMPGVEIGNNVIVGYGSVVTKNIPNNEVWAGVPAKKICTIEEYINKNQDNFHLTLGMDYEEKKKYYLSLFK